MARPLAVGATTAAHTWQVSPATVYRAMASGHVRWVELGGRKVIPVTELDRITQALKDAVTFDEAAALLGITGRSYRRGVTAGRFPHTTILGRHLVTRDQLTTLIEGAA